LNGGQIGGLSYPLLFFNQKTGVVFVNIEKQTNIYNNFNNTNFYNTSIKGNSGGNFLNSIGYNINTNTNNSNTNFNNNNQINTNTNINNKKIDDFDAPPINSSNVGLHSVSKSSGNVNNYLNLNNTNSSQLNNNSQFNSQINTNQYN
jgi:hypothetical protein